MRVLRIAAIVLVVMGLGAGFVIHFGRRVQDARFQDLKAEIETALAGSQAGSFELHGTTRLWSSAGSQEWQTLTRQAGGRALITLSRGPEKVTLLDDGRWLWQLADPPRLIGPSSQRVDWALLRSTYRLFPGPRCKLAGTDANAVRIVSSRTRRPAEVLWIARREHLLLARETYDADGHIVSRSEVTRILPVVREKIEAEIGRLAARLPKPLVDKPVSDSDFARQAGFAPLRPTVLPSGYREVGLYARTCPRGRTYAELVYTDGLRVLTIHERPGGGPGGGGGRRFGHGHGRAERDESAGPVLIDEGQAKMVRIRRGPVRIFVTGDLTRREMLRLVNSIP